MCVGWAVNLCLCVYIFDSPCNLLLLTAGLYMSYLHFWDTLAQNVSPSIEPVLQENTRTQTNANEQKIQQTKCIQPSSFSLTIHL